MAHSVRRRIERIAQLTLIILAFATGAAFAQSGPPPAVGTGGTTGVISGNPWTVCRADTNTAWLSANNGGTYNAVAACQSVGYTSVTNQGGTCGDVCGYCGTPGLETYDGGGGSPTSLSTTVHWECSGFVGVQQNTKKIDTTKAAQEARARFGLNRASSLVSNQPDLIPFLSGSGGARFNAEVTRGFGNVDIASNPDKPVWATLSASWSDIDGADGSYALGAVGAHWALTPDIFLGGMLQFDHSEWDNGLASVKGTGWFVGPYLLVRAPDQPLYFDLRVLAGQSDNRVSPIGTYTDSFSSDRVLARAKVAGELQYGNVTYIPNMILSHTTDDQSSYMDGNGNFIPSQDVWLTEFSFGLDFSVPYRDILIFGGISGIVSDAGGSGVAQAISSTYEGTRGAVRLGFSHEFASGTLLRAATFYDGLGQSRYENFGLDLSLSSDF